MPNVCMKCETILNNGKDIKVDYKYVYLITMNNNEIYRFPVYLCQDCVVKLRKKHPDIYYDLWDLGLHSVLFYKKNKERNNGKTKNTDSEDFLE